ncbi:MAG: winged helix-turn-helix domain-containing protein, partial [Silvibacterium sp.]
MILRFEQCDLDLVRRTLRCNRELVSLNAKTFDLLVYLAAHAERVVTKDELLGALWPDSFVEESNLSQHVFLLRKALTGHKAGEGLILTIPGRGYQFAGHVKEVAEEPLDNPRRNMPQHGLILHAVESKTTVVVEEEETDDSPVPTVPGRTLASTSRKRTALWVGAAMAVALAIIASVFYWRKLQAPSPDHVAIVVADLENLTHDSDFDSALQQALQIDLEQSPFLDLLPRAKVQETLAEMQQPRDARLTPALAREVCERNNAPVMLHGTISKLGNVYLLMLGAESCVSGKEVAGARAQTTSKDHVLAALDAAAGRLRKQLGESPASLERFQTPVAQASTSSLEALRIYSQAGERFSHGDEKTAQTLLERAIGLDPNFAYAYSSLGSTYYNRGDFAQAATFYKKAFELRERTTERERLNLEINYYAYGLNDYEQAIRSLRLYLDIYPQSPNAWSTLCNLYTQLGEYSQAIEAGEHALRIDSHSGFGATVLARAYKRANRFHDAKQAANTAIANGWDSSGPHSILFQIAYAEQDAAAIKTEGTWGLTHQHANQSLDDLGFAAASDGKLREAINDFSRARTESLRNGDTDYADETLLDLAGVLIE